MNTRLPLTRKRAPARKARTSFLPWWWDLAETAASGLCVLAVILWVGRRWSEGDTHWVVLILVVVIGMPVSKGLIGCVTFVIQAIGDPGSDGWRQRLGAIHHRLSELSMKQNDLVAAVGFARRSLELRRGLAARFPENDERQVDLGNSCLQLANALQASGKASEALDIVQQGLDIADTLAARHPEDDDHRDSLCRVLLTLGDIQAQTGDLRSAARSWQRGAPDEPGQSNTPARSTASTNVETLVPSGRAEAPSAASARDGVGSTRQETSGKSRKPPTGENGESSARRLAAEEKAGAAELELALGNIENARALHAEAHETIRELSDPDRPGSAYDWAAITALGAEIARAAGDTQGARALHRQLDGVDLSPEHVDSRFRRRFLPVILDQLLHAAESADCERRIRLAVGVLRMCTAGGFGDDLAQRRAAARKLLMESLAGGPSAEAEGDVDGDPSGSLSAVGRDEGAGEQP